MSNKLLSRRKFVTGLAATLLLPSTLLASTSKSRNDLYSLSEQELLARLIFGEARQCPIDEQLAIGLTTINRLKQNKSYYGKNSLIEVILKENEAGKSQYTCFQELSNDPDIVQNFKTTLNPQEYEPEAYAISQQIAKQVIHKYFPAYLNQGQTEYVTKETAEKLSEKDNWFTRSKEVIIPSPHFHLFDHKFVKAA